MRRFLAIFFMGLTFIAEPMVSATDHRNSEEDAPLMIEDAYPVETGALEQTFKSRFMYLSDRLYVLQISGGTDWGAFENMQIGFSVIELIQLGHKASVNGPHDAVLIRINAIYNFNQETPNLPAISVGPSVETPMTTTGEPEPLIHAVLPVLITKTVGNVKVNVNAGAVVSAGRVEDLRAFGYRAGASVEIPVGFNTNVAIGGYTETCKLNSCDNTTVFEAGLRYRLTQRSILFLSIGSGFGMSSNNPDQPIFTFSLGYQGNIL